jgi:hypothetical protein
MREVAEACNQEILGRCFLETQSYGGDVWQDYLDEEQGALLETDPSDWTDDWLTRLHLFNVVLQDAERWAELSGHQITVTLDGIFADLVGEDRKRLLTLFSSYAHNDAAAALRLAEVCGVDLASEHPELVLNNCEFPPFLAVAVQRAVAEDGAAMFWRLLLAEAGLRSHFSAMILHGQEAPERLAKTLGALPRKKLWSPLPGAGVFLTRSIAGFTVPPHEASAYGAILTIAALEYDHQHDDLKALSILARVPPPGAATSKRLIRVVALLFAVMVAYLLGSALSPPTRPEWVAVIAISILVAIPVFRYPARRDHRYATLANIVPPGEYWPEVRLGGLSALLVARRLAVRNTREALGKIYLRRLNLACAELEVLRRPYDLRRRHLLTVLDDEEPEAVVTLV